MRASALDTSRTLSGRYELLEVIGRGGMGTVYRATDLVLRRTVAVKVLPTEFADADAANVVRFQREARAAAALADPRVVAVYDTGVDEATRFIVMEYVRGRSVEALLRDEGPLQLGRAVDIAIGVADALRAAHERGIVHRDIKPGNVMLAENGSVKVLDFGLARAADATALTHTDSVLGTAAYMAPEQVLGRTADERSDIYSLGCVLYALLAGRPPLQGDTVAAILHQQVNTDPPPLRTVDERIPAALDQLVSEMLAKAPDARPQTATQLRERLVRAGASVAPPGASSASTAALTRASRRRRAPARDRKRRDRRVLAAVVAAAAVVIAILAVTALTGGGGAHPAPAHARRATAAKRKRSAARARSATTTTGATTTPAPTSAPTHTTTTGTTGTTGTPGSAPRPATVAGSAGALATLLTRDVETKAIEQPAAQQISNAVNGILNAYEMGHGMNIAHEFANLTQQLEALERNGQVSSAAAPALGEAVARLQTAISDADPEAQTPPNGQPGAPPAGSQGPTAPAG